MQVVNPAKSIKQKQNDKFVLEIRVGKLTIIELSFDASDKHFVLNILSLLIIDHKSKKEAE